MLRPPHTVGGRGKAKLDATLELSMHAGFSTPGTFIKPPPGLEGTPFVASRARFLAGADVDAHAFDPALWMPYLEAACYLEPRLLLDPSPPKCDIPIAKFRAPRTEALEFIRQLDKTGRLFLSEPELAPKGERMSLIAVFKNAEIDRTVWDRRRRNNLEFHI